MKKRKICFVITSHIHYSRSKLVLEELQNNKGVELQIVIGGSAILPNYGDVEGALHNDGFQYDAKIVMNLEGGSHVAMAKTAGIGVSEFASVFDNLKPDIVVVRGDRYEVLSPTIAAAYLNISIAHLEGGDVTGTIDESVRHAATKLSHIHFVTNEDAARRLVRMGEDPQYVLNVGCPGVEYVAQNDFNASSELVNRLGVGDIIDIDKPFLMVMKHPVTTEPLSNQKNTEILLHVIHDLEIPTIWFWPNVDAGTDSVSKAIRVFRDDFINIFQQMSLLDY
ncbi:MAG: UDP-N-acetylglucosamine 2-epimerase (hydrolyzing) [Parcubacteria group bacterium]|nr:UDP-N-acetylglucosamine 2-epimerase (hydrolyzing) [Parcubacteria group bacterium]